VRLATWNINGLRARLDFLLHWLRARQPDVVGLQELKLPDEKFPRDELLEAGYHAIVHGQKSWNGVAILTRREAVESRRGLPGQQEFGSRLVTADLDGLSFTTVYVPNGKSLEHEDYPRKLAWMDDLAEHFAEHHDPAHPTLLCGDFNVCPTPLDSWNEEALHGKVHHTDAERDRYRRLLDWGFKDVFRERNPELRKFSWWDYRGGAFHRKMGLRIDFLLATQSVLDRVTSVEIDRDYRKKKDGMIPSDHAPVIVDLD